MDGVVEVIIGRERRRRWSVEQKLQVVSETQEPGTRVSQVAARHGVCESLVFSWRRQAREGVLVSADVPIFLPVQMSEAAPRNAVSSIGVAAAPRILAAHANDHTAEGPPLSPAWIFIICWQRAGAGAARLGYSNARKWHGQPLGGADGPRSRASSPGRCTVGSVGKRGIVRP
jgi:transposase-like protein